MREHLKKIYPVLLPPLCILAGVLSIIFFFCGPVAKGNYDVLAIGVVAILLAIIQIIVVIVELVKERKK